MKFQVLYLGFGFTTRPYRVTTGCAELETSAGVSVGVSFGVSGFHGEGGVSSLSVKVTLFWVVGGVCSSLGSLDDSIPRR